MYKITYLLKTVFLKIKNLIIPSKLSDIKISGKKSQFTKELGLVKYEKQEIPLPRVTETKKKEEDKETYLEEQVNIQKYYLYQFANIEKTLQKKRIKEFAKKNVTEFISILHFLSYKSDTTLKKGSFSPLYNVNVNSVQFSKNNQMKM
jgi:hypothetical protein